MKATTHKLIFEIVHELMHLLLKSQNELLHLPPKITGLREDGNALQIEIAQA
jgi:hypothetical protein